MSLPLSLPLSRPLPLPLPQSPEFARACEVLGLPVRVIKRVCGADERLRWQVQSRRLPLLGAVELISRGPVAAQPDTLQDWLHGFRRWHGARPLLLNAQGLSADALRRAGFWPVMTPATLALLPLGPEIAMRAALHQKWRNRLSRTERSGLDVQRRPPRTGDWVLQAESAQAAQRGYRALPPAFTLAFEAANPRAVQVFEVSDKGVPLAAAVILRHGPMATWQIGHSTGAGRRSNAMNLALWSAMVWLAGQGHTQLDLGTLDTRNAPGLARFKLGTGAVPHRLGGTWLHQGVLAPLARRLPQRQAA